VVLKILKLVCTVVQCPYLWLKACWLLCTLLDGTGHILLLFFYFGSRISQEMAMRHTTVLSPYRYPWYWVCCCHFTSEHILHWNTVYITASQAIVKTNTGLEGNRIQTSNLLDGRAFQQKSKMIEVACDATLLRQRALSELIIGTWIGMGTALAMED
jgi:hypothetical protein